MDEKLIAQLRFLKKYLDMIKKISAYRLEEYLADDMVKAAAERYLQLSIETCINIGSRIISIEQFNKDIPLPETYSDVFEILYSIGIIDENFSKNLKKMAKFRNKLVHMYWELEDELVYDIIKNNISDIERFMKITSDYIKNTEQ
ncbi:Uncharacterized conserved protein YutE, UPF0331/DUF86 family [Caloramator quimbayensis]|uniref:Uncharacterized conserved protein YutE, UPF0331/DUF86 family n=1 Tax=Caloramator quimbayensis TaxID=1147123 RepID=A0A1T4WE56_9CLOT|nr:DUF86 domain-containing protein [Caloramator quimbayensis]SKA75570.1 Uncharacterized conserved protein YutE, UPF0331/DUF86 family [Caloramator quimbayensis]